jgi:adenosylcobinamide-GDP ribazoletransferase
MGRAFKESIRLEHLIVAGAVSSVAAGLVGGITGVVVWSVVGLAVLLGGQAITSRLGGLTGDSYGAFCELTEAVVLVSFGLRLGGAAA